MHIFIPKKNGTVGTVKKLYFYLIIFHLSYDFIKSVPLQFGIRAFSAAGTGKMSGNTFQFQIG
jgi:hypothetical protein